jgi:hypothetical protein
LDFLFRLRLGSLLAVSTPIRADIIINKFDIIEATNVIELFGAGMKSLQESRIAETIVAEIAAQQYP